MPFAVTWMDLEGIMLSENKSDGERQVLYATTVMWSLRNETNKLI